MPSTKTTEKRIFRTRSRCPQKLQGNMHRALRETFYLVSPSSRSAGLWCQPASDGSDMSVSFLVLGETGNAYTVKLDYVPTCNCPNFEKDEDICKHLFFVLLEAVGFPKESSIIYQKAYLTKELVEMLGRLKTRSIPSSLKASPKACAAYHRRTSSSHSTGEFCCKCNKVIRTSTGGGMVHCRSRKCNGIFHAKCLEATLPDLGSLSLGHRGGGSRTTRTTVVSCPSCHASWEQDEGYTNLADMTGQRRYRDKSTYRPTPGYF